MKKENTTMSIMNFFRNLTNRQPSEEDVAELRARVEASEKEEAVLRKINEKMEQLKSTLDDVNQGKASKEAIKGINDELVELNKMLDSIQDIRKGK